MSDAVLTWVISLLLLALMAGIAWVVVVILIRRFTSRYGGTSIGDAARIAVALKMPRQMDVRGLSRTLSRRAVGLRLELPGKRTVLPSAVTIGCSDYDYEVLEPVRSLVGESIAEHLVAKARERNWIVLGNPSVSIVRDDTAPVGVPLLSAAYDERAARRHLATVRGERPPGGPPGPPGHLPPPPPPGTPASGPPGRAAAGGVPHDPPTRVDPQHAQRYGQQGRPPYGGRPNDPPTTRMR